ncbi:MAG TPA: response regulator [Candidatus Eisenbacteria bacterium]|nr:response regulator [Candidatus Eisenbacteria bacterium]
MRHRRGPCGRLLRAGLPLVDNSLPVVIADDDPDIREMVRTALQLDGFHVLEASNGQTAWELILARRPVVVLADVQMPGIGGLELTARIKAHGYHETKVILFTGGMATEKQAQMAGADAYVTKSAPLSELRAAVRRLCPRTA